MALKVRGTKIYGYRSFRRNGRVTGEYVGAGPIAILMEEEAIRQRAARKTARLARRQAIDAQITSLKKVEREVGELAGRVNGLFVEAMTAGGYHRHKREWRQRMSMKRHAQDNGRLGEAISAERARRLFEQAGADTPALIERLGGRLARRVQERLIARLSGDPYVRESIRREAEELRRELCGERATVIERLIVERIIVAWLNVCWTDLLQAAIAEEPIEPEIVTFCVRLSNAANRGYLAALRSLALIRKAAPAVTVSINQTVNVHRTGRKGQPITDRLSSVGSSRNELATPVTIGPRGISPHRLSARPTG